MAKADPNKFAGPIASRYGERLRDAAMQVATPASRPADLPAAVHAAPILEPAEDSSPAEAMVRRAAASTQNTCIRVLVSAGERDELDSLLNNLSKAVGARVKLANVLRASINQLLNAEEQIVLRAQKARREFGARPANSDALALARFEDQLRNVVEAGLLDAARRARPSTG